VAANTVRSWKAASTQGFDAGERLMILSHQHRFLMLAPWKTASSTSYERLKRYNESPYSPFYDFNPYLQRVVHQHITFADLALLPESRLNYFTAAFVRNPYDRVYSGFLQLQRDIRQQPAATFPCDWIKALVMRQLAENFAQLAAGDFDFNKWFGLVKEYQIYEVGRNSSFPLHPAHYWTGLNFERKVDFVGRVENFEVDFETLCQRLELEASAERPNANVSDVSNVSGSVSYPRYKSLMDAASISKINTIFSADFELFEYQKL
jgi:hypothetical protein